MSTADIQAVHWRLCHLLANSAVALVPDSTTPDTSFWTCFAELADANLVTPAVCSRLQREDSYGAISDDFRDYFQAALAWNTARNQEIQKELARAIQTLNDREIVPVLLKGAAYINDQVYPDAGDRILGDLDILVPEHQAGLAQSVLSSLGYVPDGPPHMDYEQHHHREPLRNPACQAYIEIHQEAISPPLTQLLSATDLIRDARVLEKDGMSYALPSPTHAALISFVHSQLIDRCDANARINIRSMMDVAHLNARYGAAIDWNGILGLMESNGLAQSLRNYFCDLQEFAGLGLSPESSHNLRARMHCYMIGATLKYGFLQRFVSFLDNMSAWRIDERYGTGPSFVEIQLARARHLISMVRSALRKEGSG
ncbi:MAG: nucleotidyltransferase family protein [Gammaproteobacteria bacterium]|nr:nucleotidyltransferase family protein [Gammaproteobacteria bacterium]